MRVKSEVKSFSRVRLLVTPWTAAHQAPLSMGFSRQEYWSGVPLPSLDLTDSLEEITNSLITIPNQLDSLTALAFQNRRGLDHLTAEKGGLCLFLEEACCF